MLATAALLLALAPADKTALPFIADDYGRALAEGMPAGQRSDRAIAAVRKRLDALNQARRSGGRIRLHSGSSRAVSPARARRR